MRVLLLVLCLLLAACGHTSGTQGVRTPAKEADWQPRPAVASVEYELGAFPTNGTILPLPKGFYGYVTVKGSSWDQLHVVCSKQIESHFYITRLDKGIPYTYKISESQSIRLTWKRVDLDIHLNVEGLNN